MFIYAEVKPHYRTSIQGAQRAASAGSMRPPQAMLGCRSLLRAGKPRRYLLDHRHAPDECVDQLTRQARAGRNRIAFSGRLGGRALPAGRYRARLSATDAAGNRSATYDIGFRVVGR